MVTIYALFIQSLQDPKEHPEVLEGLPQDRKDKILRYRLAASRKQSLGAGLLLRYVLNLYGKKQEDITYNQYGKPIISDFYFNISHSHDVVICAVGNKRVGCDVEKVDKIQANIAERFFSKKEIIYLEDFAENEKTDAFYRLWTMKESYVKMTGEGMSLPLNAFEIAFDDSQERPIKVVRDGMDCECYMKEYEISGYKLAVCSEDSDFLSKITYV